MNRNLKMAVLAVVLSLTIGTSDIIFAAPPPDPGPKHGPRQERPGPRISRERAIQIALRTHRHAKVDSIRLSGGVYTVILATREGKFILEIGADSGRVLKDQPYRPAPGRPRK
jgi:hypothetical protein